MKFTSTLAALTIATAITSAGNAVSAQDIYVTNLGHTEVTFGWSHANVSMQHGEFTKATGTLTLNEESLEDSSLEVSIDMSSVRTGVDALDHDLMSKGFLDAAEFPEATFKSTSIEVTGDTTANVTGNLTLHGVTKPVVLATTLTHKGAHPVAKFFDSYKGQWVAFHATTAIDHQAFGIGSFSTGPITIEINTELQKQ